MKLKVTERAERNRLQRSREESKLFRIERAERWTHKDIIRSDDRTKENNKSNTLFSKFQSKEKE